MQWANEKEERKENLERWIEGIYRILEFAKELRDTLNRANSKNEFLKIAKTELQEQRDPWLKDEFNSIIEMVTY